VEIGEQIVDEMGEWFRSDHRLKSLFS